MAGCRPSERTDEGLSTQRGALPAGPSGADDRSPLTREVERAIQQLAP